MIECLLRPGPNQARFFDKLWQGEQHWGKPGGASWYARQRKNCRWARPSRIQAGSFRAKSSNNKSGGGALVRLYHAHRRAPPSPPWPTPASAMSPCRLISSATARPGNGRPTSSATRRFTPTTRDKSRWPHPPPGCISRPAFSPALAAAQGVLTADPGAACPGLGTFRPIATDHCRGARHPSPKFTSCPPQRSARSSRLPCPVLAVALAKGEGSPAVSGSKPSNGPPLAGPARLPWSTTSVRAIEILWKAEAGPPALPVFRLALAKEEAHRMRSSGSYPCCRSSRVHFIRRAPSAGVEVRSSRRLSPASLHLASASWPYRFYLRPARTMGIAWLKEIYAESHRARIPFLQLWRCHADSVKPACALWAGCPHPRMSFYWRVRAPRPTFKNSSHLRKVQSCISCRFRPTTPNPP